MELEVISKSFQRIQSEQVFYQCLNMLKLAITEIIDESVEIINTAYHGRVLSDLDLKIRSFYRIRHLDDKCRWVEKELNSCISDYEKDLKKNMIPDISKAYIDAEYDEKILNRIISYYFLREGMFDVLDCFVEEAGDSSIIPEREEFEAIHRVLNAVKAENFEPALEWVSENKDVLKNGEDMLCTLHKLKFAQIVKSRASVEAFRWAQPDTPAVSESHLDQMIHNLESLGDAGLLVYSSCCNLLERFNLDQVGAKLYDMFRELRKQPFKDHLDVSVTAGAEALLTLLEFDDSCTKDECNWKLEEDLILALPLRDEFQFHSTFICQVSAEPFTQENPPVLLECGHVLCLECREKLTEMNGVGPDMMETVACPFFCEEVRSDYYLMLHF